MVHSYFVIRQSYLNIEILRELGRQHLPHRNLRPRPRSHVQLWLRDPSRPARGPRGGLRPGERTTGDGASGLGDQPQ